MAEPTTSIADLLEATNCELAGTVARVYRRVGVHLQRTHAAIDELSTPTAAASPSALALLGKGSFHQQSVATLKELCKQHGIKGYSKLKKPALAAVLERHGVEPPPTAVGALQQAGAHRPGAAAFGRPVMTLSFTTDAPTKGCEVHCREPPPPGEGRAAPRGRCDTLVRLACLDDDANGQTTEARAVR